MIIYSKSIGNTNAAIGKLETPIKMIIEHESDLLSKKGGACSWLYNVEKSSRFGETIVAQSDFDIFQAAAEGSNAVIDSVGETYSKFIEHIQFMKEFVISAEMMEDARYGIATEAKRRAENFTRAYYKTINKICTHALVNGMNASTKIAKATLDLTTCDGLPLFSKNHVWGSNNSNSTQSNYYYGDIVSTTVNGTRTVSTEHFSETLSELAYKLRSMKDENGEPLGYTADTIVIPGNRPALENAIKKVCGTYNAVGSNYNDINVHFGNWNVIVLPTWEASNNSMIIMSSEANKNLSGNMFFNRVPLTITNWVDNHTGNYIWNGRCRFGVGFGTYKHAILAVDSTNTVGNATKL